ncbi:A-kinase anchor protein 4-like [Python bivittatus]|uniref:A-kinase anchor protein 4-like n=1 Tax=Python bivittatus TaxID=176946 RepID=A0A9F5J5G2_PYTBI|nr:A-kinase anchor protein 4-like [Python bivittatus]
MAHEIDWLHSQSGLCKVDLYSSEGQSDQDRKVICFVDVANLNIKNRDKRNRSAADPSLDLRNLEEKEVIVIKDNEQNQHSNTEGAVCLFKQGSSEEVNVVSWLSNDLQKYAVGFQHALTPSGPRKSAYESPALNKMSQGSDTSFRGSCSQRGDDLSYYVNKLCSLVVQMAHKEMKDKLESSGRCIRQSIRGSNGKTGDDYGKLSPKSSHDDPRKASLFYGEMSNQSNQNGYRQGADRQMLERKQSGQDDGSVSKGLMVYANQVASDMMFSFMKTMKVQKGKHPPPACVVLKKVLLKHTREVISDLIDSTMKNLHNVTGVLMTDSDFVNTVKKNLFNAGTQKSTEILEAMVKRLFKALSGDDKRSQSLAFAALKAGAHSDSRSQGLQFATLKGEMHGPGGGRGNGQMKPLPSGSKGSDRHCSMDVYAKDLIVTALMLIQQHLLEKNKEQGYRESNTTSFGYVHDRSGGSKYSSRPCGGRQDNLESQKGDISSILLSIIQKVLREAGCADESFDKGYKQPAFTESRPQRALSKSNGSPDMYDNMEQINRQFIDQLVESVMKLCMLMAKGSDSDGRYSGKHLAGTGSEVIVNNQNCNNSTQNRELQAVLQWLVASQFNVPNLTFMNEHDGELAKLPHLADKAAKKGYSVGDIVQEVMKYYEKQQMDAMSGRMPRCGLVEWLLANL